MTPGADFDALPTSVVIPANQNNTTVTLSPIDDATPEPTETATLAITGLGTSYTLMFGGSDHATVEVVDNDLPTLTESNSDGSSLSDSTDDVATPAETLVARTNTSLTFSVDGPGDMSYAFEIYSGGSLIDSGTISPGAPMTLSSPCSYSGYIILRHATNPSVLREVKFQFVSLDLQWNGGYPLAGQDVAQFADGQVDPGESVVGKTINIISGQRVSLTLASSLTTGAAYEYNVTGYMVSGYDATLDHGHPDPWTHASDAPGTAYYYVDGGMGRVVAGTVSFASSTYVGEIQVNTAFNVTKPGPDLWGPTFQFTGQQDAPTIGYPPLGKYAGSLSVFDLARFNALPAGPIEPSVSFVQLVRSHRAYLDVFGLPHTHFDTHGEYWLDHMYPYDSGTASAVDVPQEPLSWSMEQWVIDDSFDLWVMWTPAGGDSIPVPVAKVSWAWSATATYNYGTSTWDLTVSSPPPGPPYIMLTGTITNTYPEWNAALTG